MSKIVKNIIKALSKNFGFIELTDGTSFKPIQVVYGKELSNFDEIEKYPMIKEIYKNYLGRPYGERAHDLLHTSYIPREKI